jgi:hypothetical protein
VGQHDRIQLSALAWQAIVVLKLPLALKQAAVDQHSRAVGLNEIRRTRHLAARGAMKGHSHHKSLGSSFLGFKLAARILADEVQRLTIALERRAGYKFRKSDTGDRVFDHMALEIILILVKG